MIAEKKNKVMGIIKQGNGLYEESQKYRKQSLLKYKAAGEMLMEIREELKEATKNKPIEGYTSFNHFLLEMCGEINIKRTQAYKYIFLAENWELAKEIKLLEFEKLYRLERSVLVLKWAVKKKEDNPNWIGTAEDYWEEMKRNSVEGKKEKEDLKSNLEWALNKITELENIISQLSINKAA